ncbi:hypothetical protein [Novosphingobium sp.]|uniref:hypothetical protein n=1 Tax=Novosphingobium sp. TaxID=1874826 RepID=UPI0031D0234D
MTRCSTIAAPSARLACYDGLAGQTAAQPSATSMPASLPAPATRPATQPVSTAYTAMRKRSHFEAIAQEVEPLPHGLFRLHLADGSTYDTSMEGAHIVQGTMLHIRRSPLGTTFVDLPSQAPIPVRLVRPD